MKTSSKMAAQGDLLFRRVAKLPKEAVENTSKDAKIVGHSETGHHHIVETPEVIFFTTPDPFVAFMKAKGPHVDVVHHRSFDTHAPLRLLNEGGGEVIWEIRRQKEFTPRGWARVED